jgi:asparagine synthase (glutamine-hydrolysing)
VAAVAARIQRRRGLRLPTFTEVPRPGFDGALAPSRYADETPFVTAMARRYDNLVPTFVRTDGQCYVDGLDEFFEWAEMPFTNASNRPWMEAIARRAHDAGVGALLTGAMGNLTISWTGQTLLPALLRRGQWRQAWREARGRPARLVREGLVPLLPEALYCYLRGLRDHEPWTAEPWLAFSPILPEFAREQEVGPRAAAQGKHFAFQPPAASRQARIDTVYATAFGRIVRTAQVARFGVDSRDATGDRRVFEFCLALPESQFQRDGARRWLLRRAMAHRLPAEILNNPRRGLQAADWFERLVAAQPALLAAVTDAECSELARAVIDLPRLRRLTEALPTAHGSAWVLQREYRGVYETGLSTALFLRWFEASRI